MWLEVVPSGPSRLDTSYEFDEYGRRIATSETGASSQKTFVGGMSVQDEVADTGLMMMGHRFYAPDHGRFLNRDPIGFRGGLNLFEYGRSSPIRMTDSSGLIGGGGGYYSDGQHWDRMRTDEWIAEGQVWEPKTSYEFELMILGSLPVVGGVVGVGEFLAAPSALGAVELGIGFVPGGKILRKLGPIAASRGLKGFFRKTSPISGQMLSFDAPCKAGMMSLDQASSAALRNGLPVDRARLMYWENPGLDDVGAVFRESAESTDMFRFANGKVVIALTDNALSDPRKVVSIIAHELKHIDDFFAGKGLDNEFGATVAEKLAWLKYRK